MTASLRLPSLEGLRAFEAAARAGSFERAADELHISASAVSKRVATVEALVGAQLFTRGAKAVVLTATGQEYLAQVSGALSMLAAIPLHQRQAQGSSRLRVTVPPTFARQVLVPHLDAFSRAHGEVDIEIVLSIPHLNSPTSDPDTDVEVRYQALAGMPAAECLMADQVLPLASPLLLARLPPLRTPHDLGDAPLLRTPLQPWVPWFIAAGLRRPEPHQGPRFLDLGLTLEAAVGGQGLALGRPSLAQHWLSSGSLVAPFDLRADPSHQYGLQCHATDNAAAMHFCTWLREVCDQVVRSSHALISG
jgi:LysR family transcriptional regulator, glycine cleavage system transcriptional activator